ncbi:MAG TPA: hypothetical protein VNV43_08445 [Candidatus Acidoferrales bacterium]|jgi:hypothetical protein|nr:hypothetical protein [Candidatus Acidoferrales bacterium]
MKMRVEDNSNDSVWSGIVPRTFRSLYAGSDGAARRPYRNFRRQNQLAQ